MEKFTIRLQNLKFCTQKLTDEERACFETPVENKLLLAKFTHNGDKLKLYGHYENGEVDYLFLEYPFVKYGEKTEIFFNKEEWEALKNVMKWNYVRNWISLLYSFVYYQLQLHNK